MSFRLAPAAAALLGLLAVAACAVPGAAPVTAPTEPRPAPTAVPVPARSQDPTPSPNAGDVDGRTGGPELTIEFPRGDLIDVTIDDPAAKAWRIVVSGTGALAGDRLELVAEVSDVYPLVTVTEVRGGQVADTMDLSGYVDETAATGGCHATLGVCVDSSWLRIPEAGDAVFAIRLQLAEPTVPLTVTGATAGWPGEPFVLGPWAETEAFPWGAG